ncbi:putative sporulation protein YyaC [Anoxybacillus voinovskiensis]|uniref:Putative sporulation protein YyaC n=1 Tax=Anoxybacteroides voinovskiense TaxID=230470 RepID=A0A840DVI6_9BACL|nr:spore protease YyaC [Anoxybacillus voinovskiensis]MBB4075585.1 putative sporulation protein YyaC [Anoxybacillus voinovskiensis]GGJ80245.1 hypothetical protein GCM10008982_32180 [Anoxybacillus voinovskiensis]
MQFISYDNPLAPLLIRNHLFSFLPTTTEQIVLLCIGSNRINGDSLGPFVGTLLTGLYPNHLTVIGTLKEPLDATNLGATIHQLTISPSTCVVAIDSVVGMQPYVHSIAIRSGPLKAGSALNKRFPAVGDVSIMGVMLEEKKELHELPYTNLHVVYQMARAIATGISLTVRQRFSYHTTSPVLT